MNIYHQGTLYTKIHCHSSVQFLTHVQNHKDRVRRYLLCNGKQKDIHCYAALTDIPYGKRAIYIRINIESTPIMANGTAVSRRLHIMSYKVIDIMKPFSAQHAVTYIFDAA